MALKAIKQKIRSVEKTGKVTKAMEAVSAAKMRKAQSMALNGRAYARAAVSILARVSGSKEVASHPLTRGSEGLLPQASRHNGNAFGSNPSSPSREQSGAALNDGKTWPSGPERHREGQSAKRLYIVITSDKGLAGALNGAVLRAVYRDMRETEGARVIAVGRKAHDFFIAHSIPIEAYYPNNDRVSSEFINELVQTSAQKFANEEVDAVKIAYQNFISTFEQRPTIRTIFPLTLGELQRVVDDILPVRGVFSSKPSDEQPITYTIEPSEEEVLGVVLPRLASIFVYHALLESLASEHSARMTAMKSASDKAEELTHKLTIDFNKARQAAITREVSELTSGIEAMAN